MKHFLRSTTGKVVTFIICVLCFILCMVSVAGVLIMAEAAVYTRTEQELTQEIAENQIRQKAQNLFVNYIRYTLEEVSPENSDAAAALLDSDALKFDSQISKLEDINLENLESIAEQSRTDHKMSAFPLTTSERYFSQGAEGYKLPSEPQEERYEELSGGRQEDSYKELAGENQEEIHEELSSLPQEEIPERIQSRPQEEIYEESQKEFWEETQEQPEYVATVEYGTVVPDRGNLIFCITDEEGREIAASEHAGDIVQWDYSYEYFWNLQGYYGVLLEDVQDNQIIDGMNGMKIIFRASLKQGLPENDSFRFYLTLFHILYAMRYMVYVIGGAAFLLMVLCFIILMCTSARRPDSEDICPGHLNGVPFDLMLAVSLAVGAFLALMCDNYAGRISWYIDAEGLYIFPLLTVYLCMFLGLCMSAAARIKQKALLRNTVIFYILKGIWILGKTIGKGIVRLPLIWKSILVVVIVTGVDWLLMLAAGSWMRNYFFLNLFGKIVLIPIVLYIAWCLRRLLKSGEALAGGDLAYHTDTKGLFWDFRKHGENLNQISDAMTNAVNDRMKSERMKTELITNVSHDIKTPLTSIINYADLIGQEPCDNPKIQEYAQVLVRQSDRLKRLIEDLVEASKASTGNLEVELMPCSANLFLVQAAGEYKDKLSAAQLELILQAPEEELTILADGRRMWRIFDNLMNNICKYSLAGTRVYLSLERYGGNALFTFRNTSKEPLNITEEELMERFTRGDSSRHTEGNGLGLSIAKSLTQLQNGELRILIDGDLFKAQLEFALL